MMQTFRICMMSPYPRNVHRAAIVCGVTVHTLLLSFMGLCLAWGGIEQQAGCKVPCVFL